MEKRKKGYIKKNYQYGQPKKSYAKTGVDNKEIIFGTRAVIESINAGKEIEKLFIQRGVNNELTKILLKLAQDHTIPVSKVPVEKLNAITRKNHQGAIAYLSAIKYASLDNIVTETFAQGKLPFLIILDRITDVRNFGAIARTAECAGVDAIIVPQKGGAQITSDAMKTSAGALNYMPVCRQYNLKETINYLKESGISVVACTEKTEDTLYDIDLNQPIALLMGSEENGISGEYLSLASAKAKIPMAGKIGSLNVSVATAIGVYETIRQRLV